MPKEIKSMRRSRRRQYMKVDNIDRKVITKKQRESTKSATRSIRNNTFQRESSKREQRESEEENVKMTSTELLHTISGGIIENSIKYIMFPLHLLSLSMFGTNSIFKKTNICEDDEGSKENKSSESKKNGHAKNSEASNKRSFKESPKDTRPGFPTDTRNATGLLEKPLVVAEEDSDSSTDRWSTASSTMIENVFMVDRSMSLDSLLEPMDISMKEHTYERSQIVTESLDQNRSSTLSLDSEIARMFQKQCTSSDESCSSCDSSLHEKRERTGGKNFLFHGRVSHSAAIIPKTSSEDVNKKRNKKMSSEDVKKERKKKTSPEVETERNKKTLSEDVARHKSRTVSQEENKSENQNNGNSVMKSRKKKRSSKQDTSSKSKTRSLRTAAKTKESKRKDVKYKETATQTDSAFSDDDVEMIPVDGKLPERRLCCKRAVYRSHPNLYLYKETRHKSNHVVDNEYSSDRFARIARERVSSSSTSSSSSSTDLGFDERATPMDSDVITGQWHANTHDTITSYPMCSRAPPGFPEVPQNPPLLSYSHTDWYNATITSLQNNPCDVPSAPPSVPRGPSPMRHLYYDYPEFMDFPTTANSSKILDLLRTNW